MSKHLGFRDQVPLFGGILDSWLNTRYDRIIKSSILTTNHFLDQTEGGGDLVEEIERPFFFQHTSGEGNHGLGGK